jgi:hypothetical protein
VKYVLVVILGLLGYGVARTCAWSFAPPPIPPLKVLGDRKSRVRWNHDRWVEVDDDEDRRRNAFGAMGNSG